MSASLRSTSHAVATNASSVSVSKPTGTTTGDLLVYSSVSVEHTEGQSSLLFDNSGDGVNFVSVLTREYAEGDTHHNIILPMSAVFGFGHRVFSSIVYRVAGASEPGSYTFNYKTGGGQPFAFDYLSCDLVSYQGGYTSFPFTSYDYDWYDPNAPPQGKSTIAQTSWGAPGLSVDPAEALLSIGYAVTATSSSSTPPSGWTETNDNWQTGSGFLTTSAVLENAPIPAGGPYVFTSTVSGTRGVFVTLGKPINRNGVWINPDFAPLGRHYS